MYSQALPDGEGWEGLPLEVPLHAQAGAALKSAGRAEVVGEFDLCTEAEVVATEVLANVIPELRLGDEHGALLLARAVGLEVDSVILPPEVGETVELQALHAEEVVHSPNNGELHRHALLVLPYILIECFEVERVLEVLAMEEVVDTCEHGVVDRVGACDTAVVLHLQREVFDGRLLPEVEAACYLEVCAAGGYVLATAQLVVVEVVVDEEVGVTPLVLLEHLKRKRYKLAVATKIVEQLCVNLCLCLCCTEAEHGNEEQCRGCLFDFHCLLILYNNIINKKFSAILN